MKFLLLTTWNVVLVAAFLFNTRPVSAHIKFPEESWPLCYIGNDVQGTCEHLVNCQQAVDAVYRGLHPPACYWQRHQTFPVVCCPHRGNLDDVLIPIIPPVTPVPPVQQEACGRLDTLPEISGDSTPYDNHVWPWMVSIYKEGEENIPVGSGFLIDDKHILTAAQSFPVHSETEKWNVKLERTKRDSENDQSIAAAPVYTVQEVQIHDGFRSWVRYDDLALVTLNDPVENAQPICLPSSTFDPNALAGINATILGVNREEQVPVVSSSWCNEMYTKFAPLSYPRGVDEEFFCAGLQLKSQPEAPSAGNMGGPVMMQTEDGAWMAVGLVSLDYKRTEQGLPGVYLNLAHYKDWIDEKRASTV